VNHTERIYYKAQLHFDNWCQTEGLQHPISAEKMAVYLKHCLDDRGASTVPVRLSAIGRWYRDRGLAFDIKAYAIQEIVQTARRQMRVYIRRRDSLRR
jgi:hypothetical protein